MNNKLKLISLAVISTFTLVACNGGNNSSTQGSATPISGAHVEADVINGKIYEFREYRKNKLGQVHLTLDVFPHGSFKFRHLDKVRNKLTTHYFTDLNAFNAAKPSLDKSYSTATNTIKSLKNNTTPSSLGFDIGFNPSIGQPITNSGSTIEYKGVEQPYCYNVLTQINNSTGNYGFQSASDFTATNSSSSNASVLNEKNNIEGSYGLFSASNALAYSNNYQGSTSNGSFQFSNAVLTNIGFTVNSLSDFGKSMLAQNPSTFIQNCGSSTVQTMPMGWMVTLGMQLQAGDTSQTSSISDTLKASYSSMLSMTNQLSDTSASKTSSFTINFSAVISSDYTFQGGYTITSNSTTYTIAAGTALSKVLSDIQTNTNVENACTNTTGQGNLVTSSCVTAVTDYDNLANQALAEIPGDISKYGLPSSLEFVDAFPQGINLSGLNKTEAQYQTLASQPQIMDSLTGQAKTNLQLITDPYAASSSNLGNYIQLIWQLNQLSSAANFYASIITNGNSSSQPLNAQNMLIDSVFSNLSQAYFQDAQQLTNLIGNCISNPVQCSSLPTLSVNNVYDFYNTPAIYNSLITNASNTISLNNKALNSLLLQYNGKYSEYASLGNPGNVWSATDNYYVGSATPSVNNSVPMAFVYLDPQNVFGSSGGIVGVALAGLSMANPFCQSQSGTTCTYEQNGSSVLQSGPLASSTTNNPVTLSETPFYYFLRDQNNGFAGLINNSINPGVELNNYFMMAQKFVSGTQTRDFPNDSGSYFPARYTGQVIVPNTYPTSSSTTPLYISSTGNGSSTFSISSYGAGTNSQSVGTPYNVNGVFGPAGQNYNLYGWLLKGPDTQFTETVSGLDPNWVLGVPSLMMSIEQSDGSGCYSAEGAYKDYNGCDGSGLYPYNDSDFTTADRWGALATSINSTENTVTFTQISNFFN